MANVQADITPAVLHRFAQITGTTITNGRLDIPERYGKGYCAGFVFSEHIRLMIFNYELYEDMVIDHHGLHTADKTVLFKFQNCFLPVDAIGSEQAIPSVLIATSTLTTDTAIPVHSHTATINIDVSADYLSRLPDTETPSPVLQSLRQNTRPLLFEQMVSPALQAIVAELLNGANTALELFLLRIKAEELVCRLLMELEKRGETQFHALNGRDIQTLYAIKELILSRLDTPPVMQELADTANMSQTKLKRLFKQIFGQSIFSYYQAFRMQEAARLLTTGTLTVSEVGYQLGFTNLSHFTRVFETHIGLKPKKYAMNTFF